MDSQVEHWRQLYTDMEREHRVQVAQVQESVNQLEQAFLRERSHRESLEDERTQLHEIMRWMLRTLEVRHPHAFAERLQQELANMADAGAGAASNPLRTRALILKSLVADSRDYAPSPTAALTHTLDQMRLEEDELASVEAHRTKSLEQELFFEKRLVEQKEAQIGPLQEEVASLQAEVASLQAEVLGLRREVGRQYADIRARDEAFDETVRLLGVHEGRNHFQAECIDTEVTQLRAENAAWQEAVTLDRMRRGEHPGCVQDGDVAPRVTLCHDSK